MARASARALVQQLDDALGLPVAVENRAGAGVKVAAEGLAGSRSMSGLVLGVVHMVAVTFTATARNARAVRVGRLPRLVRGVTVRLVLRAGGMAV